MTSNGWRRSLSSGVLALPFRRLYGGDMETTFAPITLNGEPIATWRTMTEVVIDGRLYFVEASASEDCGCRRCCLHDDFGGCLVAEALWGLVTFR